MTCRRISSLFNWLSHLVICLFACLFVSFFFFSTDGANFPISVVYKAASRGTQGEDTVVVNMLQEPKDNLQELTSVPVNPLQGQSIAKTGTK